MLPGVVPPGRLLLASVSRPRGPRTYATRVGQGHLSSVKYQSVGPSQAVAKEVHIARLDLTMTIYRDEIVPTSPSESTVI